VNAPTPAQAAYEEWAGAHTLNGGQDWQDWDEVDADGREIWDGIAQAVLDASVEGTLRALGFTLDDVARFIAAQEPNAAPEPDAGAKLTAIRTHCERKAAEFSADMFAVRPQDIRVNAGDILAIIDGVAL
jgi:hypothetical protein